MSKKKIAIIGAGTSSIGFLHTLKDSTLIEVDIYDEGPDIRERIDSNSILKGFGGAGTFSDGKLSDSPYVGGTITDLISIAEFRKYSRNAINLWKQNRLYIEGSNELLYEEFEKVSTKFKQNDLNLQYSNFYHLGTDVLQQILIEIRELINKENFHFHFNTKIDNLPNEKDYDMIIIATGRYDNKSSQMVQSLLNKHEVDYTENQIDIGIRYEIPYEITKELTELLYEFKVLGYSDTEELVRTFCVNPQGYVVEENGNNFSLVNGHSYSSRKSWNTNFAILVTQKFTEPFKDAYNYGSSLSYLSNKLGGNKNVLIQRYGDFKQGRRTTDRRLSKGFVKPTLENASAGDLNLIFPRRIANSIEFFIEKLSNVIPGMNNPDNLMYGLETKFYSKKPKFTNESFKLNNSKYYMIGDASGYTRGIVQATISGIYLANKVLNEL
jgi:uncharacterized protein